MFTHTKLKMNNSEILQFFAITFQYFTKYITDINTITNFSISQQSLLLYDDGRNSANAEYAVDIHYCTELRADITSLNSIYDSKVSYCPHISQFFFITCYCQRVLTPWYMHNLVDQETLDVYFESTFFDTEKIKNPRSFKNNYQRHNIKQFTNILVLTKQLPLLTHSQKGTIAEKSNEESKVKKTNDLPTFHA